MKFDIVKKANDTSSVDNNFSFEIVKTSNARNKREANKQQKLQEDLIKQTSKIPPSAFKIKNGKLAIDKDVMAQNKGFSSNAELESYKRSKPEMYEAMGGIKYVPQNAPVTDINKINLSNAAVNKVIERYKNTDVNEINKIINLVTSGEWQDADTMKKYSDKVSEYVNDYIMLNNVGYLNYLPENERKNNIDLLKKLKEAVNSSKSLFAKYNDADSYNRLSDIHGKSIDEQKEVVRNYFNAKNAYDRVNSQIASAMAQIKASGYSNDVEDIEEYVDFLVSWHGKNGSFKGAREAYGISKGYTYPNGEYDKLSEKSSILLDLAQNKAKIRVKFGDESYVKMHYEELAKYWENLNTSEEFVEYYKKIKNDPKHKQYIASGKKIYDIKNKNISDEEYEVACYYLGKGDKENYYFTWLEDVVYKREVANGNWSDIYDGKSLKYHRLWSDYTKAAPLEANLMSVALNLGAGAEFVSNTLKGDVKESKLSKASSKIREAYANSHDGKFLWIDHDMWYNTGMSAIDSIVGNAIGGPYALAVSVAASGVNDALNRGMTGSQAFLNGLANGINEYLWEKYSFGQLDKLKESKDAGLITLLKNVAKTSFTNASEEGITEMANILYDTLFNGDLSHYALSVKRFIDSGYTEHEAKKQTFKYLTNQIGEAAVSGALMGIGFGSFGAVSAQINADIYGENYYGFSQNSINALVDNGLAMVEGSEAYKLAVKADERLKSGKSLSGGTLYNIATAIEGEIESKSTSRLLALGVDKKTTKELSPIVAKAVFGEQLTSQEHEILKSNRVATLVVNELSADKANTIWKDTVKNNNYNFEKENTILHPESNDNIIDTVDDNYVDEIVGQAYKTNNESNEVVENVEGKYGQFYSKERSETVQSLSKSQPRYSDLQDISDDNTTRRLDRKNYLQRVSGNERGLNYFDYTITEKLRENFEDKVELRFLELGVDKKAAKVLSPVVVKAVFGEQLTSQEHETLKNNKMAAQVVNELSADRSNTIWKDAIKNNNVNFYDYANKNNILHSENNDNIINTIDDDYVDANANTKDIIKTRQADVLSNVIGESRRTNNESYENKALNESELTAILNYKSSESYRINDRLRNFENLSDVEIELVKNMDNALIKMPTYQGVVYRNISFDWFGGQEAYDAFLNEHKLHDFVTYLAYTSASTKVDGYLVDGHFAVSMVIESRNAKNVEGYGNNFESEVIFPRNSVFLVNNVEYSDKGQPIIYMTEVIDNDEGKHGQFYSKERSEAVQSLQKSISWKRKSKLQDISDDNTTRRLDRKNYLQRVSGKERRLNYNDNNIKEGEKYAEDYQRTMGSLGREIEKDDTSANVFAAYDEGTWNRERNSDYDGDTFAGGIPDTFNVELDEFIAKHPEWFANRRESYADYKRKLEATSSDEVAFLNSSEKQADVMDEDEFIRGLRGVDRNSATMQDETLIQNSTNAVTNPLSSYAPAKRGMIVKFIESVDERLKAFVERVRNGSNKFERFTISDVNDREAADIKNVLGVNVEGYTHNINTNGIKHILKRHGVSGTHDKTMSNDNDIARMGWVIENYDHVEVLVEKGEVAASAEFRDKANRPVTQIRYSKKINGTYYVVEAVFENDYNKLWVQSAYLKNNKEGVTQAPAESPKDQPHDHARSALASPPSNNNISQSRKTVNDEYWNKKTNFGEDNTKSIGDSNIDSVKDFNYNDNNIKEGEAYNGENTELLERGAISTTDRGNDVLRKPSNDSRGLAVSMEISQGVNGAFRFTKRTGKSGWLDERKNITGEKTRESFDASVYRRIRGVKLSGKDTVGGIVSPTILERFKNTICKDEKGNLISLYHWTLELFEKFAKGEFGFHFGTLRAAYDRYLQTKEDKPNISIGIYKEVILNITNPIELREGVGDWNAYWIAIQLLEKGIIDKQMYNSLSKMSGFVDNTYDNPAAEAVRNILAQNGFDGIVYENISEDVGSYSLIALYPEQIITVSENGILKENSIPTIFLQEVIENVRYNADKVSRSTVQHVQTQYTGDDNLQGVSERDTDGDINRRFGSQFTPSVRQWDTVRSNRRRNPILPTASEEQEINNDQTKATSSDEVAFVNSSEGIGEDEVIHDLYNADGNIDSVNYFNYNDNIKEYGNSSYQENNEYIELSTEQKAAILRYKSGASYIINAKLRESESLNEAEQYFVDMLDKSLHQLPVYKGTVYRNVVFDDFGGEEAFRKIIENHIPGQIVFYEQFLSCSKEQDGYPVAGKYQVRFVIESNGVRDIDGYGNNMEREVIYPLNTVFIVKNILIKNKIPVIYLKEIIENDRYRSDETKKNTVQYLQAPYTIHGNVQSVFDENTIRYNDWENSLQGVSGKEGRLNYSDNSIKEGENYNGEDTKLLERGAISTTNRGNDVLWQQGTNSEALAASLEVSQGTNAALRYTKWSRRSGWLDERKNTTSEKARKSLAKSFYRRIRGVKLSGRDTTGGIVNSTILERFKDTICKDENGNLILLYHWTTEMFDEFAKGEFGFHFGTLKAAYDRYLHTKEDKPDISNGVFKEVILNITNPIEIIDEANEWNAHWVALQLLQKDIIDEQTYKNLSELSGFDDNTYDNPAVEAVRNILAQNGFDGIVYENISEDVGSYSLIALYPEQIITVSENGILKENSGINRAALDEVAFSMPINYSYEFLINKPNMQIVKVDGLGFEANGYSRKEIIDGAVENAKKVGRENENRNAVVYVKDIDGEIVLSKSGLRHGLDRRLELLAPVVLKTGEILKNAVRVNELSTRDNNISMAYVLVGVAKNENNDPYIISFVVNRFTSEVNSIDVLYAINAKTEPAGSLSPSVPVNMTDYFTGSNISISKLLDCVNKYFPDILSESVLRHYGYDRRPEGKIGESAMFSMPIGKRERKNNVIELSKDNELSKRIGDLRGSEKYKVIQQYILDALSGEQIVLSDGKVAVVDKSDALHIANKAANKKTAQISKIKEIVQKAVLVAEEESVKGRKFDYFYYYEVAVKYDNEIFNVYLDVGRARNDGTYHIYDITNKIRDTANRINGLERPKPNEGYALTNGISNNSIIKTNQHVNNNSATNTDMFDEKIENADTTHETGIDFSQEYVDNLLEDFGITSLGDYIHVQMRVMETLEGEGFFTDKENRCTKVVNDASGMVVEINKKGIKETFDFYNYICWSYEKKIAKLATIRKLSEIIKYGELIKDNVENAHEGTAVNKKFAYIRHTISVDGKAITLQIDIKKSPEKNKFWVHKIIKIDGANNIPNNVDAIELGQTIVGTKDVNANNIPNNVKAIELGYTEVSVDKVSVSQESKNVNDDSATNTDIFAGVAELNSQEIEYIEDICNNLGCKVVFEDLRNVLYKGDIVSPDGYIKDGVLHINTYAINPLSFVFKHELAHFCENSSRYKSFVEAVEKSSLYKEWIKSKTGKEYLWDAEDAYRQMVYEANSMFESLEDSRINKEIIADFVGDMLFTDNGSGMAAIISEANTKHHNALVQFILDFISFVKKKLSGQKFMTMQLSLLEDSFNRVLSDATNMERNEIYNYDNEVSFCFVECYDQQKIAIAQKMEQDGKDYEYIFKKCGLIKDAYGKWKHELNTGRMRFYPIGNAKTERHGVNEKIIKPGNVLDGKLNDFVTYSELYDRFPKMANMRVVVKPSAMDTVRFFVADNVPTIAINKELCDNYIMKETYKLKPLLLRELQKAIQYFTEERIGKSLNKWKEMEANDQMPYSEHFKRKLSAEEANEYAADNYEASMVEKRNYIRQYYVDNRLASSKKASEMIISLPKYDRNKAVIFDENNNPVTVKEYENPEIFNIQDEQINEEIATEDNIEKPSIKLTFEDALKTNYNSNKLRNFLNRINIINQDSIDQKLKIKAGFDSIAPPFDNAKSFAEYFNKEKIKELSEKELNPIDDVGRIYSEFLKNEYDNTFLKSEHGQIVSFYALKMQGIGGFKHSQLGLVVGTLESIEQIYAENNKNSSSNRVAYIQEIIVNMKNPLVLDYTPFELSLAGLHDLVERGIFTHSEFVRLINSKSAKKEARYDGRISKKIRERMQMLGYDGIIYMNNTTDPGSTSVVVFEENQIVVVAENGKLISGNGIEEISIDLTKEEQERDTVNNINNIRLFSGDAQYKYKVKRRIPSEIIRAGESDFLESTTKNQEKAYQKLCKNIAKRSSIKLSGEDTVGRKTSTEIETHCCNTSLKNIKGDLLSLYAYGTKIINLQKAIKSDLPFTTLNTAILNLALKKENAIYGLMGAIQEFYVNSIHPLIVMLDEYDAFKIAKIICDDGKISKKEYMKIVLTGKTPSLMLKRKLSEKGYDCIIVVQKDGEYTVHPFLASQIIPVAENGVLNADNGITQEDTIDYEYKDNYKLESVVIDRLGVFPVKVEAIKEILPIKADNTTKMKMLTKVVMCNNDSGIDYSNDRIVGRSGVFEKGEINVWRAKAVIEALINRDFTNIQISNVDTYGRPLGNKKRELLKGSKTIDNFGRPYSFFLPNRYGDKVFKGATIALRVGTLNAAHDIALYAHEERSNVRTDIFEECFVIAKNPYFIMFDPNDWTPSVLGKYMYAEGLMTNKQYLSFQKRAGVENNKHDSSASLYLIKILKEKGFDSIAFMSVQFDPGSIGIMVFKENQLILISRNGLPVENSDKTLADSDESAFFVPENNNENFVKKSKSYLLDRENRIGYNENEFSGLTYAEKQTIKQKTGWSDGIIDHIRSVDEAQLYINANLKEAEINGRKCLIRSDIDMDYVEDGLSNRERIKKGLSPVTISGEKVHLHHIGQKSNGPLAELTASEHLGKGKYSILHDTSKVSKIDRIKFASKRKKHWKTRFNTGGK